jgi:hypothetical protein
MKKKGNGQNQLMYRDTYRIVKQISWYVSIRQTVYRPSPTHVANEYKHFVQFTIFISIAL